MGTNQWAMGGTWHKNNCVSGRAEATGAIESRGGTTQGRTYVPTHVGTRLGYDVPTHVGTRLK